MQPESSPITRFTDARLAASEATEREPLFAKRVADLHRPPVELEGVVVGIGGRRLVTRFLEVLERLFPVLRFGEVVGQGFVVLGQAVGVELFDGPPHQAVQRSAPFGQEGGVGDVVDQGVLEHVGQLGEAGFFEDQFQRSQVAEHAGELVLPVGDAGEDALGELPAHHRGQLHRLLRLPLQAVEAGEDDLLDRPGDVDLLDRAGEAVAAIRPGEDAGLDERPGDLLDVERVAFRLGGDEPLDRGREGVDAEHPEGQRHALVVVELAESRRGRAHGSSDR
jgi:hypothetical protein